jgi:hypothetical protein
MTFRHTQPPLTYASQESAINRRAIKFNGILGIPVKEELPIYSGDSEESLLVLVKRFKEMSSRNQVWTLPNAPVIVYSNFERLLVDSALDDYLELLQEMDEEMEEERTERGQEAFNALVKAFVQASLGDRAFIRQRNYLRKTPKPASLSVKQWVARIRTINSYMPLMAEDGDQTLSEVDLIQDVITENIPHEWRKDYLMQGLHKEDKLSTVLEGLLHLETCEKLLQRKPNDLKRNNNENRNHNHTHPKDDDNRKHGRASDTTDDTKGNPKTKNRKTFKNECKLEGHKGHEWADCFNNPRSANFKGSKDKTKSSKDKEETKNHGDKTKNQQQVRFMAAYDSDSEESHILTTAHTAKTVRAELLLKLPNNTVIVALVDSGSSASLMVKDLISDEIASVSETLTKWTTQMGVFTTSQTMQSKFKLPQFSAKREVTGVFHIMQNKSQYDAIIGRDILSQIGLILDYKNMLFTWDDISVSMQNLTSKTQEDLKELYFSSKLKPASYNQVSAAKIIQNVATITTSEKAQLENVLVKHEALFQGTKGHYVGEPVSLTLISEAKPVFRNPYPIPVSQQPLMKEEVDRLVSIGLLSKVSKALWSSPSFAVPKKNNTIRLVTDFRVLNKVLVRHPYPMPTIPEILQSIGSFVYATTLDLSMGYYSIPLDEEAKKAMYNSATLGYLPVQLLTHGYQGSHRCFSTNYEQHISR